MKQPLMNLIVPNADGVKNKLNVAADDTRRDSEMVELHRTALHELDETLNRKFTDGEPAFFVAKDCSESLAAFWFENPIDMNVPTHIEERIEKIRFNPGF